jgi:transposase
MEATLFTGWIYDLLKPLAQALQVAHPPMVEAIAAAKKKNDKVDARMIADLLRCNLLPEYYMALVAIRDLRRVLRYLNLVVGQATRVKNRIAGLLMETGTAYNKERLHGKAYFSGLLGSLQEVPRSVVELLQLSRGQVEFFAAIQRRLLHGLRQDPQLSQRVMRLQSIPSVGEILALSWALEVGEVGRFPSIAQAVSYCGLTSAQHSSASNEQRAPISKQRNRHLQTILIEAAKLAPRYNPAAGRRAPTGTPAGESQPGDAGGGAQASGVPHGGGQEWPAVPDAGERRGGGLSRWVDFGELRQRLGIEQVLTSYRVPLQRVGLHQLRGACPLPTHSSERSRQSFSVDPAKNVWACHSASCSEARHCRVGATFCIWWRVWRGARFGRPRCACRVSGVEPECRGSRNGLQKEAQRAEARIDLVACLSLYAWAVRTWRRARFIPPQQPGLEWATMPVADSYGIGSCFRSTITRDNWWRMLAAASMVASRGTCSRQASTSRRWYLISIVQCGNRRRARWGWKDSSTACEYIKPASATWWLCWESVFRRHRRNYCGSAFHGSS